MPLYDFDCQACHLRFEQIVRAIDDPEAGTCPKCGATGAVRQVARFRIGGRGDLRETTEFHGCHSSLDLGHGQGHDHDHGSGGHVHGPGCGHGGKE